MKRIMLSLFALGLVVLGVVEVTRSFSSELEAEKVGHHKNERRITVDVACDGRTWRYNRGITDEDAGRGDTFMVFGPIYPAGTLPTGTASNSPDDPGSIGTWTCRGTSAFSLGETPPLWIQVRRGTPGVVDLFNQPGFITQYNQFDDGGTLVSDGPAGLSAAVFAVVGGMGAFSGARGEVTNVIFGTNSTGFPNFRMTFNLKKQAPK
jgi:hypothetical protein